MSPGVFAMHRCATRWRCAMALVLAVQACMAQAADATVWVFTAARLPPLHNVNHADRLFVLDHADSALRQLSFPNPGNAAAARDKAMAIIQSPQGRAAIARMRDSAEATTVAWQYGIEKLPAVLVDERFVVYGVYDVVSALGSVRDAR